IDVGERHLYRAVLCRWRGRLGGSGGEQRQVVGKAGEGAGLLALLQACQHRFGPHDGRLRQAEIGRASGRERVGQYVLISVVSVSCKTKQIMIDSVTRKY